MGNEFSQAVQEGTLIRLCGQMQCRRCGNVWAAIRAWAKEADVDVEYGDVVVWSQPSSETREHVAQRRSAPGPVDKAVDNSFGN